ncbi:hypothetical protein C900_03666 [Fulvivirga imtechensis AK7]|uniref:Uncharacterized protein n=1 Tax=Fulvivirga imtechensis AK7 TaxID=1237149 RepID=L8JT24_9BACT|nr:hypothetical protein [Fulvivirga imtechensis]ELR70507.1 hypothetical protein C900_03666 [Fulvivirga imtechensis AK7]
MLQLLKKYVFFLFLFILPSITFSQGKISEAVEFNNKHIPRILEKEIKKALSYFPELKYTAIDFVVKNNIKNNVMQAQPRVRTLFKNRLKRTYKIKISRNLVLNDTIKAIENVPTEIIVGWIAHELGHIMDYLDRSAFQMIGFGFRYVTSKPFLRKAERKADVYAIRHGLADEIIETKKFILYQEDLTDAYKEKIDRLYISPEEVEAIQAEIESNETL